MSDTIEQDLIDVYHVGVHTGFIKMTETSVLTILRAADELGRLNAEVERLRSLITEWYEADASDYGESRDRHKRYLKALRALRAEVTP